MLLLRRLRTQLPFRISADTHNAYRPQLNSTLGYRSYGHSGPLPLSYALHEPPAGSGADTPPVLIMHGLFGSKQNNRSISKALAKGLNRPVYAIDLRNHGDSPQDKRHDYEIMAQDVENFIEEKKLKESTLIGHSMGAKTAMAVALRSPELVQNIIAVDNAPIEAMLSSTFASYVQAMRKIEESNVKKQSEADAILKEYEPNVAIRQFLLTNLTRPPESPYLKFRIPIRTLANSLDHISGFPFHPDNVRFEKPALFIRGTKSHYVSDETIPIIGRFFPLFQLKDIEAGHWVISENPEKFLQVVGEFLQPSESNSSGTNTP